MNGRTQSFPVEHCPKPRIASSGLPSFSQSIVVPSLHQVSDTHALDHPHYVEENVQHGHSDQSVETQSYTQQAGIKCLFRHLFIRTSINFFRNLCYRRPSVGSDNTGLPSLPRHIDQLVRSFFGTTDQEHPIKPADMEMLFASHEAITFWPLSKMLL